LYQGVDSVLYKLVKITKLSEFTEIYTISLVNIYNKFAHFCHFYFNLYDTELAPKWKTPNGCVQQKKQPNKRFMLIGLYF